MISFSVTSKTHKHSLILNFLCLLALGSKRLKLVRKLLLGYWAVVHMSDLIFYISLCPLLTDFTFLFSFIEVSVCVHFAHGDQRVSDPLELEFPGGCELLEMGIWSLTLVL